MTGAPTGVGRKVAVHIPAVHELLCGDCRQAWRPDRRFDAEAPFQPCAGCGGRRPELTSAPVPGALPDGWLVRCDQCGASWVADGEEDCGWCVRALAVQRSHQAELVLQAPDVELGDEARPARLEAWADRLAVAVRAGLLDERTARRRIEREERRGR